ncbi:MAG TPA: methyltransferase domain-containing protein [Steroidobacteraceae bacterium]|nr:methyltransferase domain-containing protein [Steroidobacteraceae bacterium]
MNPASDPTPGVAAATWLAQGRRHLQVQDFDAAQICLERALVLQPDFSDAYELLGKLLYREGRTAEASANYRRWLREVPGHPVAAHMVAATGEGPAPPRASDACVTSLYRRAAVNFDATAAALGYRAPELLYHCATTQLGARGQFGDVLDLGCGTGLCGALFRETAGCLTGVDLSEEMLDRARQRGCYDHLVEAELTQFLDSRGAAFDLVIAADVFCYFGNLEPAFAAVAGALRPNGHLVFSVEAAEDPETGHVLQEHGRYAHALRYLEHVLGRAGLAIVSRRREMLRFERGAPVEGWIMAARQFDIEVG